MRFELVAGSNKTVASPPKAKMFSLRRTRYSIADQPRLFRH
jgi:hypothetical protein